MLEVAGLVKTYPTGDQALRGVSLTVKATEVVFVIGPSGAGKSTLIRCINRLVEPDARQRLEGELHVLRRKLPAPGLPEPHVAQAAGQDVLHYGEPLDQVELLEDHRHVSPGATELGALEPGDLQAIEPD